MWVPRGPPAACTVGFNRSTGFVNCIHVAHKARERGYTQPRRVAESHRTRAHANMTPTGMLRLVLGCAVVWAGACFKAAWDTAAAEFGDSHDTACSELGPGGLCGRLPGGLHEAAVSTLCHAFRETCATPRVVTLTKHTFQLVAGNLFGALPLQVALAMGFIALLVTGAVVGVAPCRKACRRKSAKTPFVAPGGVSNNASCDALALYTDGELEAGTPTGTPAGTFAFKGAPWVSGGKLD